MFLQVNLFSLSLQKPPKASRVMSSSSKKPQNFEEKYELIEYSPSMLIKIKALLSNVKHSAASTNHDVQ